MNFLPFFMYWLIGKDSGTNSDLCKNDTNGEVGICLSRRHCVSEANGSDIGKCNGGIPENVCCKVTLDYGKNASFDQVSKLFRTSNKEENYGNIILHPVHSFSQYTRPLSTNSYQESIPLDFSGNVRRSVHLSAKYGNLREKRINPVQNPEKSFNFSSTKDFRKSFYLASKLGFRKSADLQNEDIPQNILLRSSRHNLPYILRSDSMPDFKKLHEVYRPQNLINLTELYETDPTNTLLRSVQVESTSNQRRSVDPEPKQSLPIPTLIESKHDLREAVQLDQSHDMRKPVQTDPTHNLRKPVQTDPKHNLRKTVQSDSTHDLRKPVETDPTHYQRKPVRSMESHDLRWPVVEEVDHDLRNLAHEEDIFRSSLRDSELNKILNSFLQNKSEDSFIDKEIDQFLHEDEFLNSQCNHDNQFTTDNTTNDGSLDLRGTKMQTEYREIFNESLNACGIQFNSSIQESTEERNSKTWPWMVSIQEFILNRFWHKCSGSLISSLWVVTAAHCMESRPKWDFLLHLGSTDPGVTKLFTERFIDKISIHPKFNNLNFDHDIALLRMNSPVVFQPDIVPVCLPERISEMERKMAVVLGWRLASEKRVTSSRLQEKNVPVLTNRECEIMFSETGSSEGIQTSFLCAGFEDKLRESCNGDSGGPLTILNTDGRWSLGGLYSWGKTCSSPNQPEVYIRVSRYARWIEGTIACYESNMKLKLRK